MTPGASVPTSANGANRGLHPASTTSHGTSANQARSSKAKRYHAGVNGFSSSSVNPAPATCTQAQPIFASTVPRPAGRSRPRRTNFIMIDTAAQNSAAGRAAGIHWLGRPARRNAPAILMHMSKSTRRHRGAEGVAREHRIGVQWPVRSPTSRTAAPIGREECRSRGKVADRPQSAAAVRGQKKLLSSCRKAMNTISTHSTG